MKNFKQNELVYVKDKDHNLDGVYYIFTLDTDRIGIIDKKMLYQIHITKVHKIKTPQRGNMVYNKDNNLIGVFVDDNGTMISYLDYCKGKA